MPNNLPSQLTSFVGREAELTGLASRFDDAPLVTLTGVGGAGKTRLAIQFAAERATAYADGVWLVELASVGDPNAVADTVARTLGIRGEEGRPTSETVIDLLRRKELLLILDNCEHLRGGAGALASAILRSCPAVRILATSREALDVPGEAIWPIASLATDAAASDPGPGGPRLDAAMRLFLDRARLLAPTFQIDATNAEAVARICRRLDGIPLAIELAAARIRVLDPLQIASRLDDAFRLLIGGSQHAAERQRTLRSTMDWSYRLLPDDEATLFRRLAIFSGGFDLEAAETVCADEVVPVDDVLDLLSRLVAKSLVGPHQVGDRTRYRMLETIRQYAIERLADDDDTEQVRARHLAWIDQLAQQAKGGLVGPTLATWLDRLETESENIHAALEFAIDTEPGAAMRIVASTWRYWSLRAPLAESCRLAERLLVVADAALQPDRCAGVAACALLIAASGNRADADRAYAALDDALATCADERGRGLALVARAVLRLGSDQALEDLREAIAVGERTDDAVVAARAGHYLAEALRRREAPGALDTCRRAAAVARNARDPHLIATSTMMLAILGAGENLRLLAEAEEMFLAIGDLAGAASAMGNRGWGAYWDGHIDEAYAIMERAIAAFEDAGLLAHAEQIRFRLGWMQAKRGAYERALVLCDEALAGFHALSNRLGIGMTAGTKGSILVMTGALEEARPILDEAIAIGEAEGYIDVVFWAHVMLGWADVFDDDLEAAAVHFETARAVRSDSSVPVVGTMGLAAVALARHDHRGAAEHLAAAARPDLLFDYIPIELEVAALAFLGLGHAARGARLLGAAAGLRDAQRIPVPPAWATWYERMGIGDFSAALTPDEREAEQRAGRSLSAPEALALIGETLGMEPRAAAAAPIAGNVFRREGAYLTASYAGKTVRLRATKGLIDIEALLARPRDSLHALDLIAMTSPSADQRIAEGAGDPLLDEEARRALRARVAELQEVIDGALPGDDERVAAAREELDAVASHLAAAYGLGGRSRRAPDPVERARKAVTQRIRNAIASVRAVHPELARHLETSLKTGTFCSYQPERDERWLTR